MTLGELLVRSDAVILNITMQKLDAEQGILSMKVAPSKEEAQEINKGFKEINVERKRLIKSFEDCTI